MSLFYINFKKNIILVFLKTECAGCFNILQSILESQYLQTSSYHSVELANKLMRAFILSLSRQTCLLY